MTLARARLLLGITGVGLSVVAATVLLVLEVPHRHLSADPGLPTSATVVEALWWPLAWTVLIFPLDLVGGVVLVRHRPSPGRWLGAWVRGVVVQLVVLGLAGLWLVTAARQFGTAGTMAATLFLAAVVLAGLDLLARIAAPLPARPVEAGRLVAAGLDPVRTRLVAAGDEAFVGGFGGLGTTRLLIPASWMGLPREVADALLRRRALASGAWSRRGQVAALAWITVGAGLAAVFLGPPTTAAALVRFSLGTTLWGFVGVLTLPTPSRWAVLALDRLAATNADAAALADGIRALDRWQDDEAARPAWVERIFHPVPSREVRLAAIAGPPTPAQGAWRVARLALPLGLASWGLLGRAVHCNLGRPELWWMLPGD